MIFSAGQTLSRRPKTISYNLDKISELLEGAYVRAFSACTCSLRAWTSKQKRNYLNIILNNIIKTSFNRPTWKVKVAVHSNAGVEYKTKIYFPFSIFQLVPWQEKKKHSHVSFNRLHCPHEYKWIFKDMNLRQVQNKCEEKCPWRQ